MDLSQRKEQFSATYLRAVATVAGYCLAKPEVDDDSVDWIVSARGAVDTPHRPKLEIQLKCSAQNLLRQEHLVFALDRKNYDDLRVTDAIVPRLLVVMLVPEELPDWLAQSEQQMIMHYCAYWFSLRGLPATTNIQTITLTIPRHQVLTVDALKTIMRRINSGETL